MNDFAMDITGKTAMLKESNHPKKNSTVAERTLLVVSGPGCNPDIAWGRKISVQLPDKSYEMINSYDLEYVLVDGKKVRQIDGGATAEEISFVCKSSGSALAPESEKPKAVRRKR